MVGKTPLCFNLLHLTFHFGADEKIPFSESMLSFSPCAVFFWFSPFFPYVLLIEGVPSLGCGSCFCCH